jgi:hypothetical protein
VALVVNKVKKGEKFVMSRGYRAEYTKFDWICAECGLAWGSRAQAQDCASRGHVKQYLNSYGNILKSRRRVELK